MAQDRAVLTTWGRRLGASPICLLLLVLALISPLSLPGQLSPRNDLNISIGAHWTRHILAGGWGATVGLGWRHFELLAGGEIYSERLGAMVAGRYYLGSTLRVKPFVGLRAAYYHDLGRIFMLPSYSLNYHASLGVKIKLAKHWWAQGQLGVGYTGFFRVRWEPIFVPAWYPMRMLHYGLAYDIPIHVRGADAPAAAPSGEPARRGRFSILMHIGLPINLLAPPSIERFTAGLGYDLHPKLALTLRHQVVQTDFGLKYGKSLVGVRWMPGTGSGLRWVGSLEAGHWGGYLNFSTFKKSIGVMAGQHLQYPCFPGVVVDVGLQYAVVKTLRPQSPAGSDFETSLGLVIRPGAWRRQERDE
jgi:hypothetical protein